jgi:hypothetical protein
MFGVAKSMLQSKVGKYLTLGSAFNVGIGAYEAYSYKQEKPERGWGEAAVYGASQFALWTYAFPFALGWTLKDAAKGVGQAAGSLYMKNNFNIGDPNMGGHFLDNANKATMRQRGLHAIQSSRMNARSVLGSEARHLTNGRFA